MIKLLISVCFLCAATLSIAAEPQELSIIAKRFEFLPNQIEVTRGTDVKIYLTSIDVTHGFALDVFGINKRIEKGKLTTIEFTPDKVGEFEFHCSVYCGVGHSDMKGKLIVSGYKDISAPKLNEMMNKKDFFLVDVHVPEQKHIEGTDAFIPYYEIEKNQDKLPKDKTQKIVVYCKNGSMGDVAGRTLYNLGYKNVYNLVGGSQALEKI
jgi:rhodanese-related sulfurtransferase/plastocyanin